MGSGGQTLTTVTEFSRIEASRYLKNFHSNDGMKSRGVQRVIHSYSRKEGALVKSINSLQYVFSYARFYAYQRNFTDLFKINNTKNTIS